jgi:hypothetical protein
MLAKEDVPDSVRRAYGVETMEFGKRVLIPKPFDTRVLTWVAPAVARAAMETGVAQKPLDLEIYREKLEFRLGKSREVMRMSIHKAQRAPKRVVLPEGDEDRILRAAQILIDERIARPVIWVTEKIRARAQELRLRFDHGAEIVNPATDPRRVAYIEEFVRLRQRKGVTPRKAPSLLLNPTRFGCMMVHNGDAEALIGGRFAALSRDDPAGAGDHLGEAGRPEAGGHVHADHAERADLLPGGHDDDDRADGGGSGRDRDQHRRGSEGLQHGAARGDAVVLELRFDASSADREGPAGDGDCARTRRRGCRSTAR